MISGSIESEGYDFSQRAYFLTCKDPGKLSVELVMDASPESPMVNGCFIIKNWGDEEPLLEVDGRVLSKERGFRVGKIPTLEGCDLIIWIEKTSTKPVKIKVATQDN